MPETSSGSVRVTFPTRNRDQIIAHLQKHLPNLEHEVPLRRVALFGSWATGRATAFSDVDVLIVYEGPPRDDVFRRAWYLLDLRGLELHVYTEAEAADLAPTIERMTRSGVELL